MNVAVLMPVYNDAGELKQTLSGLRARAREAGSITVFLVDDGSESPIAARSLPPPTAAFGIVLARHVVNLGQGAALETARQLALRKASFDAYVTMDADGQHNAEDVIALANAVIEGADVAFGNRFLGESDVPALRRAILRLALRFERALTGLRLHDAHNGLRAFNRAALERVPIKQNRMAHATEIKHRVSRAGPLRVTEVPVTIRYTKETLARGQSSLGALIILRDLMFRYLFGEPE